MKRLKAVGPAAAAASAPLPAFAQASVDRPTYWHSGWDWGWGHMFFGSLMMILFWGGLILVILLAVRWLGGWPPTAPDRLRSGGRSISFKSVSRGARSIRRSSRSAGACCLIESAASP